MADKKHGFAGLAAIEYCPNRRTLSVGIFREIAVVRLQPHGAQNFGNIVCCSDFVTGYGINGNQVIPALKKFFHDLLLGKLAVKAAAFFLFNRFFFEFCHTDAGQCINRGQDDGEPKHRSKCKESNVGNT